VTRLKSVVVFQQVRLRVRKVGPQPPEEGGARQAGDAAALHVLTQASSIPHVPRSQWHHCVHSYTDVPAHSRVKQPTCASSTTSKATARAVSSVYQNCVEGIKRSCEML